MNIKSSKIDELIGDKLAVDKPCMHRTTVKEGLGCATKAWISLYPKTGFIIHTMLTGSLSNVVLGICDAKA